MYPRWIVLQLLENCNLRCKMCYQWGDIGSYIQKKSLNVLDYELIVRLVEEGQKWKPLYGLFGGEPLLYKKIWDVISLIKQSGSLVYMDTNGTLVESNACRIIESEVNWLWISLDGPGEINDRQRGEGVYNKVIKGIEKLIFEKKALHSEFPKLGITYTVTPLNFSYVEKLFNVDIDLKSLDFISIEFQNYITISEYEDYSKILHDTYGITELPSTQSIVRDINYFSSIDCKSLSEQICKLKIICRENNVQLFTSPVFTNEKNIYNYFNANWTKLKGRKTTCTLPWNYAEVNAKGEITTCHTFYDLVLGNLKENSMRNVFFNNFGTKYREIIKSRKLHGLCYGCSRYHSNLNSMI